MVVHIDPTKYNRTCPRCGANVHGLDADTCPRCAGSMVPACVGCGHSLAGIPRDGRCPECGTPVSPAYGPDLLENRSVGYLASVRAGLTLVLAGVIGGVLLVIAALIAAFLSAMGAQGSSAAVTMNPALELAIEVVALGCAVLSLIGWWKVTTPDPARAGTDLDATPRKVVRAAVSLQLGIEALSLVLMAMMIGASGATGILAGVDMAIGLASLLAWLVQFFAAMLYVGWLARRVPDYKLADEAKRFMWLGPLLYVLGCVLLGLGPVIALILYLMMLFKLRGHLTATLQRLGAL